MKKKSTLTSYTVLIAMLIAVVFTEKSSAQEKGIFELTGNNILSKSKIYKSTDRASFYELAEKLHTTVYIGNNMITKIYGDGHVKKITFNDGISFSLLDDKDYNTVELITITLEKPNDLMNKLDLTTNKNLSELKYVFIQCYFECNAEQIDNFITSNPHIRVFYRTENPS